MTEDILKLCNNKSVRELLDSASPNPEFKTLYHWFKNEVLKIFTSHLQHDDDQIELVCAKGALKILNRLIEQYAEFMWGNKENEELLEISELK